MIRQPLMALMLVLTPLGALAIESSPADVAAPVEAAVEPDPAVVQTQEIIRTSGLIGLSEQARNIAQQVLNEQAAPIGQQYDVVDRLTALWAPVALEARFGRVLQTLSDTDRGALETLLASRQLINLREKEEEAIRHQGSQAYTTYVQRLRTSPPPPARVALINELDQAMQFSALMSLTREQVYPQLQAVLRGWNPPAGWQAALQQHVQEFLLYVHRSTPNDELQRLIQTYRQPVMQQWLAGVKGQLSAG
ncbi:hypothetical protein ACQUQU_16915 [Thalassolituus sp. LLYu03]|uniref:hypothetical protein n=1 Tax=Thalassolituus sp. LLYu03 TaxID=3421656 RepID=UPI003D2DC6B4